MSAVLWIGMCAAPAQAEEIDDTFTFATGLIELGFPDYAAKLMDQMEVRRPDLEDRITLVRAQGLIASRKYAEAEALMEKLGPDHPKAQAIQLALANAYYGRGETDRAQEIYQGFFDRYKSDLPRDEDLLRFYQESAYRYGLMMEAVGSFREAINAFEIALSSGLPEEQKRSLMIESAELCLKVAREGNGGDGDTYLDKAWRICEDIQWSDYDLWFGRSISIMAQIEVLRGKKTEARKLLLDYMGDLKAIDELLQENGVARSLSPMAGAQFLLGELYAEEAQPFVDASDRKQAGGLLVKALTQFESVFRKYPNSNWGPEAGVKASEIKTILTEELGLKIRIDASKVADAGSPGAVFKAADNLYRQKKYEAAAEEYTRMLNSFPEGKASIASLGRLALCYLQMEDRALEVDMLVDYIAERFAGNEDAAMQLLVIGKTLVDQDQPDRFFPIYQRYLDGFQSHSLAPQVLYTMAMLRGKYGDAGLKKQLLQTLVDRYPQSQYYVKSLKVLSYDYFRAGQYEQAIPMLQTYAESEQPGRDKAQAQFVVAESLKKQGEFTEAARAYSQVLKWLQPGDDNPYYSDVKEKELLEDLYTKSMFFIGYCFARVEADEATRARLQTAAIKSYERFLDRFPSSDLAPEGYRGLGTAQLALGQTEAAAESFNILSQRYPDSEAGKNAFFLMVDSLIEIGQADKARAAFKGMTQNADAYSSGQWVRIGQLMLDRSFYPEAAQAMRLVVDSGSDERSVMERAYYGLGKAGFETGAYDAAAESLATLLENYPRSALFYEAKFLLAAAYRETDRMEEAIGALSDIFRFADSVAMQHQASLELASIQRRRGQSAEALASYMRVALLADASEADIRPLLKTALLEGVDVAAELGKFQDALDLCEQFLNEYPDSEEVATIRDRRRALRVEAASAASAG